jgi:sterol desaturase/sphingolipid hydroxylase (fatty acid hydroxylase superfamily)
MNVVEAVTSLLVQFGETLLATLPYVVIAAVVFPILSSHFACNRIDPWWRRKGLATDVAYLFIIPIITRLFRIGLLILGGALVFGIHTPQELADFFDKGHGPLAVLPFWVQFFFYLFVSDFLLYWVHRVFHGATMWKYHKIHHEPEEVDWISAVRFHPVNLFFGTVMVDVVLLLAGIAPAVLSILAPFNVLMSAFVHANLNWTLGPFRYVLASPVFHRWHHTALDKGGGTNFAGTFPILDVMFGTFYMPKNELPGAYGIGEPDFPQGFIAQLWYPFRDETPASSEKEEAVAPLQTPAAQQ